MTSTSPSGLSFLYDGSGRRLRKMVGTTKICFVYPATGRLLVEDQWTTPTTTKDHVYFNGQLIATRDQADTVRLFFKDHLGSTRSVVKVNPPAGGQSWGLDWITAEVHNYYPYGDVSSSYWDDPAERIPLSAVAGIVVARAEVIEVRTDRRLIRSGESCSIHQFREKVRPLQRGLDSACSIPMFVPASHSQAIE